MTSLSPSVAESARTCAVSGLRLVAAAEDLSVRIGKDRYGGTGALARTAGEDRRLWHRFDSPGRTLYVAENEETAFAEVLADFQLPPGRRFHHLDADAASVGLSLEEFLAAVELERGERGLMYFGYLPAGWRDDRRLFYCRMPKVAWLVDIEHPDSIAVIRERCESALEEKDIRVLTTAHIRSDDRELTTAFASVLRGLDIDTGSTASGIHFTSKHGGGWCRALWLPENADDDESRVSVTSVELITLNRPALVKTLSRYGIRTH